MGRLLCGGSCGGLAKIYRRAPLESRAKTTFRKLRSPQTREEEHPFSGSLSTFCRFPVPRRPRPGRHTRFRSPRGQPSARHPQAAHRLKMKIKALSRPASSAQAPGSNVNKLTRNLDPTQHPFERAREYTRALNATKLERMFAQPFLGDFEPGHVCTAPRRDSVHAWTMLISLPCI